MTEFQKRTGEKRERHNESARRYREKNRAKILDSARIYYAENSESIKSKTSEYYYANNDSALEKAKIYRTENAESIAENKSIYYQNNKKAARARAREWEVKNPEKAAAIARNKRARRRGAEGSHSKKDVDFILEMQNRLCANCGTKLFRSGKKMFHVDHVMPLALGGSNWPSNLQCLCPQCNTRKGAKHPDEWAKENGRLL